MMDKLANKPRVQAAILDISRTIATKKSQKTERGLYLELCPAYFETMGHSKYACLEAWKELAELKVWEEIDIQEVHRLSAKIRKPLGEVKTWGRHILVDRSARRLCRRAFTFGSHPTDLVGFQPMSYPKRVPRPGTRENGGRAGIAACPFHDDHSPSASIWLNEDGVSGGGSCFRCQTETGNLTFAIRVESGNWWARPVLEQRESGLVENPGKTMIAPYQGFTGWEGERWGAGGCVSATLGTWGISSRSRLAGGLYESLERADAYSLRDGECSKMATLDAKGYTLPDKLVYTSEMRLEYEWVQRRDGSYFPIAISAKATVQRNILIDIDKASGLAELKNQDLEKILFSTSQDSWLSGRFAAVKTSERGLQIWFELDKVYDAVDFWADESMRNRYRELAKRILEQLKRVGVSGKVDESAMAAGRLGRRPGWRTLKTGGIYRSRLLLVCKEAKTPDALPRKKTSSDCGAVSRPVSEPVPA